MLSAFYNYINQNARIVGDSVTIIISVLYCFLQKIIRISSSDIVFIGFMSRCYAADYCFAKLNLEQ